MKVLKSFSELRKIIKKNKKISKLKEEVENLQNKDNESKLDKKLLDYFKEILKFADKNKDVNLKKLYEDLYWLQYTFCVNELKNEWQISYDIQQFFFEFQKNLKSLELIKKINDLEKSL
jgi:hypothetical protein